MPFCLCFTATKRYPEYEEELDKDKKTSQRFLLPEMNLAYIIRMT